MASWQAKLAAFIVRKRVKPALGDFSDIARVRKTFGTRMPAPRGARYRPAMLGGVPGEWVETRAGAATRMTLLYVHGGGFVGCSPRTHRPLTAGLALLGARVYVPQYRLAPEHPFPAALDDVRAAWRGLREQVDAEGGGRLVVAGDSAGGNLALALMLSLRDGGERLPDAAALFSPAVDLTGASPSLRENSQRDPMFPGIHLGRLAEAYLAGADPAQPLASPLLGDLHGLPPMLVHVGADEVLRDDSLRLADKARAAGVRVDLKIWPTVPHVWQLQRWVPEARQSVSMAASFLRDARPASQDEPSDAGELLDVLIVGAGLSGIGAAAHLQSRCPSRRYAILEARESIGGTWDLFRYPGVRSDSDMYTLGYSFKPWTRPQAIADGPTILAYVREAARENAIDRHIRFGHRVLSADWSSADRCWHVVAERGTARERIRLRCSFMLMCSGYYSYAAGYRPEFPGEQAFAGTWVDPQFWPQGLDCSGRRVLVIGSGATAMTLVPTLARSAAHVTMLQRSPTYVVALPSRDRMAQWLRRHLPERLAYRLVRAKNVAIGLAFFQFARRHPARARQRLLAAVRYQLGPGFDVQTHFTPSYDPWDQRLCVLPDGDLFRAIRSGAVSVVTDRIESFTPHGVRLASGQDIEADIVVTATGLNLQLLGGVALSIDGVPVDLASTTTYKGMMFSGVPNLVSTFGYTNASWTLKADLTARYVCRLFGYMERHGHAVAMPRPHPDVKPMPFIDFSSGYVQRAIERLPRQGTTRPWRLHQNYLLDMLSLRFGRIDHPAMLFAGPAAVDRPWPQPPGFVEKPDRDADQPARTRPAAAVDEQAS